jgi:hypothetical protein
MNDSIEKLYQAVVAAQSALISALMTRQVIQELKPATPKAMHFMRKGRKSKFFDLDATIETVDMESMRLHSKVHNRFSKVKPGMTIGKTLRWVSAGDIRHALRRGRITLTGPNDE